MKKFKIKFGLFSLLAVFAVSIFLASCSQGSIEEIVMKTGVENVETTENEVEDRGYFYLNSYGDSHIHWPYANSSYINPWWGTNNWHVTCGPNCGWHHGGDYYADDWANGTCGTDFKAPLSGTVIFAGQMPWGYGNQVVIHSNQNGNFAFRVAHLQSINVWAGQYVNAGHVIGKVGTTGNSSGCHGHCVLYKNIYQSYDPYPWQTGLSRLKQGYDLGSNTWGGPNKFAAPYYFSAGNKSAMQSGDRDVVTKEDDTDGKPYCGPISDVKPSPEEIIRWQQK